jgi:deoxyribodipyrimidine photo-lyase
MIKSPLELPKRFGACPGSKKVCGIHAFAMKNYLSSKSLVSSVPDKRVTRCNQAPLNPEGAFVLYWMISSRRLNWSFALQRAVDWCKALQRPLLILEALRAGYEWANDRIHGFIMQGMAENLLSCREKNVLYYPYLEPWSGAGKGLLASLSRNACVVVTDEFPAFFLPKMVSAASNKIQVLMEKVDSNGILPLRAAPRLFVSARSFRRFLQGCLEMHLEEMPKSDPLEELSQVGPWKIPEEILRRWPPASIEALERPHLLLRDLPLDHGVPLSPLAGGASEAQRTLRRFLQEGLPCYASRRNHPDHTVTSGLSPYLHFGHISSHQVVRQVLEEEGWSPGSSAKRPSGSAKGWWGLSPDLEAFLDQLITWRELGFNFCFYKEDYQSYESLPDWAKKTLEEHAGDPRPYLYSQEVLERAGTHDLVWNAAQRQLLKEGRLHNYLRMLWGKKILEWSPDPGEALRVMIHLNNKWALDGRDPNSYSNIFWCLGKYDRPWGPRRPIFGTVRYMSSSSASRKLKMREYLARYQA